MFNLTATRVWVAKTDPEWFGFLKTKNRTAPLDYVNHWGVRRNCRKGEFFLWKDYCISYIIGGGIFSYCENIPVEDAFERHKHKNGAPNLPGLEAIAGKVMRGGGHL